MSFLAAQLNLRTVRTVRFARVLVYILEIRAVSQAKTRVLDVAQAARR